MKQKINKIGIDICQCKDGECIPYNEIFTSKNQSISLYRCGYCAKIVETEKVARVARRDDFGNERWLGCAGKVSNSVIRHIAAEKITAGDAVYIGADGKVYKCR